MEIICGVRLTSPVFTKIKVMLNVPTIPNEMKCYTKAHRNYITSNIKKSQLITSRWMFIFKGLHIYEFPRSFFFSGIEASIWFPEYQWCNHEKNESYESVQVLLLLTKQKQDSKNMCITYGLYDICVISAWWDSKGWEFIVLKIS